MSGNDFRGLHLQHATAEESGDRAVFGVLVHGEAAAAVRVPVFARGIVLAEAAEDVAKGEKAGMSGAGIGGRGDEPGRRGFDAWWLRATRRGEVGKLKVGALPTAEELAGET